MPWQAKTSAGKYLPLVFNDNGVSGANDVLTSLWKIDGGSLMGTSGVALTKDAADDFELIGKKPAIGGLSLMTCVSSTQSYNNFGAFALYNKSQYREAQGDTFGGSNMRTLKKFLNSAISDICLVPYVKCKKFSDSMLDTSAQAGTGGSQTVLLSTYLTGMTGGQHYYEAYPHVYQIAFDVYCRVSDTPDGFGVDAAHTQRVKIASYGSGTNQIKDGANNALTVVPITSFHASYVPNYFMSNSTIAPEVAIDTGSLYVTGATNRWVFDSFGERSNGLWVTHGGLIDASGLANAAPSLGGNLLWAGWNYDSIHVTRVYNTGNAELGGHYTYFSYIDCSSDRSHLIACVNLLGFLWADDATAAVTARPGDGQTTTHVPDRAGGKKYGMPLATDHNGANTDPEEEGEEYETRESHEDPSPEPTVTPPVGPPTDPNLDEDSAGGGGDTEGIEEEEQPDDVTDGNINQIPDVSGTRKYVLSAANLEGFITYLAATYAPTDTDLTADFKGVNPMDYVVSCKWYPFAPSASGSANITVGGLTTTASGNIFNDYGVRVLYLGGVDIKGYYNSWLDFEPYVTMSLYVPFCGTIDLDTKLWMYHKLDVYLAVDYNTGSCAAMLLRDGTLTSTIDGVCGIDIQLYGKNQGDYQNAMYQAQFAAKQAKIGEARAILNAVTNPFGFDSPSGGVNLGKSAGGGGASAVAGTVGAGIANALPVIGGIYDKMLGLYQVSNSTEAAEWNVTHTAPHVSGAGSQDPLLQLAHPMFCRLYIRRAQMISGFNIGTYRATVGYSCMRTGRVGDFRGRIVCSGVWKTDGNLLQAEVEMIKSKLMKGVFVTNPE